MTMDMDTDAAYYDEMLGLGNRIWGVAVDEPKGEDQRLVIGRVVVTSITPGRELPNLHDGRTIGDRMHTVTILGNAVN